MKTTKLKWEKFPSVCPGGKSYFLVSIPRGYKIVWDRVIQTYLLMEESGNILEKVDSPEMGKKLAEKYK